MAKPKLRAVDRDGSQEQEVVKPKPEVAELIRAVADAINNQPGPLPPFPERFVVVERDKTGVRSIMRIILDSSGYRVNLAAVQQAIMRHTQKIYETGAKEWCWTASRALSAAETWFSWSNPISIDEIADARWIGESGLAFIRLPWERRAQDSLPPTWAALVKNMSNADAFCMYIGSMFVPQSYNQQYCWIRGDGGDGKGAIIRFLSKCLPTLCVTNPRADDKFWTHLLVDKRVCALTDMTRANYVKDGEFMALTGGDSIVVQRKGQDGFQFTPRCKFIVASQTRPNVSNLPAYQRRIIFCEIGRAQTELTEQDIMSFESRLWEEGAEFVNYCIDRYAAACPGFGPIPSKWDDGMEAWADQDADRFEALLARNNLGIDKNSRSEQWVMGNRLQAVLDIYCKNDFASRQAFLGWLETRGVTRKTVRVDGETCKRYKYLVRIHSAISDPI